MLSIGRMLAGQESYFLNLAAEDYYVAGGEPSGYWIGSGAKGLGLGREAGKESLSALFRGYSPSGKALVQNAGKEDRQAGWDLTFSVPKSVSVLWSQADELTRRAIQAAVHEAVASTVEYLEEFAASRTGKGGREQVAAELVVAAFEHGTSRALDPQLHVHCLVMNVGVCEDGVTRSLISRVFYRMKMEAGAFFRVELAERLERNLGIVVERPVEEGDHSAARRRQHFGGKQWLKSWFEVSGVPAVVSKAFATRRQQIENELGRLGLETAAAASVAALSTRAAKTVVPARKELFEGWQKKGRELGFGPEQARGLLGVAKRRSRLQQYQAAFVQAVEHLSSRWSHFSERDLIRATLEASQGRGLDARYVVGWVTRDLRSSPALVNLGHRNGEQRFTTKELMAVENELLKHTEALKKAAFRALSERVVSRVAKKTWTVRIAEPKRTPIGKALDAARRVGEKRFVLNEEQVKALRYVTQGSGRLKLVSGLAGTGKTQMLRAVRAAYEKKGYRVIGCAVAGLAAKTLQRGSGIKSQTLWATLGQMEPSPADIAAHHARQLGRAALNKPTFHFERLDIDSKTVVVLDEASMVGTRDFARLVAGVKKGNGILVCVGDEKQLPSIEAGGVFGSLLERYPEARRLTEITRQHNAEDRTRVEALSRGEGECVIKELAKQGRLHVADNKDKAAEKLLEDWAARGGLKSPEKHYIFVTTNVEAQAYNEKAQRLRSRDGRLAEGERVRIDSQTYFKGDRVMFLRTSRRLGVVNGDIGTIVGVKKGVMAADLLVRVDGEDKTRSIPVKRGVGEAYTDLALGYAFTTHKVQGCTVEHAYVHFGGDMMDREMAYVQGSRHRHSLLLYTDQWEAGVGLTNLARGTDSVKCLRGQNPEESALISGVLKSHAKDLAVDVVRENELRRDQERRTQCD